MCNYQSIDRNSCQLAAVLPAATMVPLYVLLLKRCCCVVTALAPLPRCSAAAAAAALLAFRLRYLSCQALLRA
jgi:hypothetical protein